MDTSTDASRVEKAESNIEPKFDALELQDSDGYIAQVDTNAAGALKTAKDGHTVLIPQPSEDPNDPLNWSQVQKHIILFIISFAAFLPDYGSAVGAVTLLPQAVQWETTPDIVNHSQAGNVFMLGAGGIVAVVLSAWMGRLPVLFYFLIFAVLTAAWCAAATSLDSFTAARILNGFFSTVAQGGGLMFIFDMFFFHERARKINIWAAFFVLSPYLGPMITAFIITTEPWPVAFWIYFTLCSIALILTAAFGKETYYDRRIPPSEQPPHGSHFAQLLGIARFRIPANQRSSLLEAIMRSVRTIAKPTVFISCIYQMLVFAWVIGINTTLSIFLTPLYGFGPREIGFFYFTPIVAALLGEIAGHWLHDIIANFYIKKKNGHFEPEARLNAIFFSTPFMIAGLVGLGFSLQEGMHYMVTAVFWGLYVFGIMITTVALTAYNLDCYPMASGEVASWLNQFRVTGGFIISYFQVTWAQAQGAKISFGVQAAIVVAALAIPVGLVLFGKKLRTASGPLKLATV